MHNWKKIAATATIAAGIIVGGLGVARFHSAAAPHRHQSGWATLFSNERDPLNRPARSVTIDNAPPPVTGLVDGVKMRYNPFRPSDGPYPVLSAGERIWIDVSIDQQLVYIFHGQRLLYTMATSSGMEYVPTDGSPLGVYHIQAQRGTWFYVPRYREGAKYWVSWLGHGVYLFHSVPMRKNRQIIPSIAARMLHEASHGCFHLTVPDAKWFYEHVPYRTTVVVERSPVLLSGKRLYDPSQDQQHAISATATT